jgi:hypothetical protein
VANRSNEAGIVAGVVLAGVAYRLVYVFDQTGRLDGDNAVVALMARHILAGRHYAFFWGQGYMGSLEPYSIAAVGALFGLNDLVLRLVPLFYGTLYMASFYWLGRRLYGDDGIARATLGAAALCPPLLAVWSSSPRGGYSAALFLGQVVLLMTLFLARERPRDWGLGPAALLGILSGLAFWTHFLAAVFLLVGAFVIVRADPSAWRRPHAWIAAAFFLVGCLPGVAHNVRQGLASLAIVTAAGDGAAPVDSMFRLVTIHGPKLFGIRHLVGAEDMVLGPIGAVTGVLFAAGIAHSLLGPRRGASAPCALLVSFVVGLVVVTRYGTWNTQRYLLPLYSGLLPLLAAASVDLHRRFPGVARAAAAGALVVLTLGGIELHRELSSPPRRDPYVPGAIGLLTARGIRHGYADHAEALVNTYRSGERVILQDTAIGRYPLEELGTWEPRAVLTARAPENLARALEALGCGTRRESFGGRELFYDIGCAHVSDRNLGRDAWRVTASESADEAVLAIDGDPYTRWASHTAQRPGMTFAIELAAPEAVSGVRLSARGFPGDFPRALRVIGVGADRSERTLGELRSTYPGLRVEGGFVHLGPETIVELRFASQEVRSVRVVQTGEHPLLDWSITEIDLIAP